MSDQIKEILKALKNSKFKEQIESNGYYFYFCNKTLSLKDMAHFSISKICSIGASKEIIKNDTLLETESFLGYGFEDDLLFIGALKTLIPSISLGGFENIFNVSFFVTTPLDKVYLFLFYFGASGLVLGGYEFEDCVYASTSLSNSFNLSNDEISEIIEALEILLMKTSKSNFTTIYENDLGKWRVGVDSGQPFMIEMMNTHIPEMKFFRIPYESHKIEKRSEYIPDVTFLKFTRDNERIIAGLWDGKIQLWDLMSGELIHEFNEHEEYVSGIADFPQTNCVVSGSYDSTIKIWNLDTLEVLKTIRSPKEGCYYKIFTRKNELYGGITFDDDEDPLWVEVWDLARADLVRYINPIEGKFDLFGVFPKKDLLYGSLNFDYICIIDIKTGEIVKIHKGHDDYIHSIILTDDERKFISSSDDHSTRLWSYKGEILGCMDRLFENLCLDNSNDILFFTAYNKIGRVNMGDFTIEKELKGCRDFIHHLSISPNNKFIAHSAGRNIIIRDSESLAIVKEIVTW
ncbi:MAG: hypothetical protein ACTSR7_16190 [Promethearchaeota archaeon]